MTVAVDRTTASRVAPGVRGEPHDFLAALGQRSHLPACGINPHQVGVPLLADLDDDVVSVGRPDRFGRDLAARRALVAADAAVDVEVVGRGQVARRAAGKIDDPEIGLAVRAFGFAVEGADEREPLAVR